jgi:3'-phosphoadenosine 5'-phosphosulfate sulfotransferase
MIKLKHLLNEILEENSIQSIVDRVYPQIVKDLGGQAKPIEIHNNIYTRIGAVAVEDLMKQNNPDAQYDPDDDIIYVYSSKMKTIEDVVRALLHEHTHTLQDQEKFKQLYDEGALYDNHPYEKAADKAEEKWERYM